MVFADTMNTSALGRLMATIDKIDDKLVVFVSEEEEVTLSARALLLDVLPVSSPVAA